MNIRELFISAITRTKNPKAPIILQDGYSSCNEIGEMFVPLTNANAVTEYAKKLLSAFPDDNDEYAADPAFIIALAGCLAESLVAWARNGRV